MVQLGDRAFPWAPARFQGLRFWYLLRWGSKRAEQGPSWWRSNMQGTDWVIVLTKGVTHLEQPTRHF